MQTQKYCYYCGAPAPDDARFCGRCGKSIAPADAAYAPAEPAAPPPPPEPPVPPPPPIAQPAPSAPPPPPAAAPVDEILGIIPAVQQSKGFMGLSAQSFNLIVTSDRLVFAFVSTKMASEAVTAARQDAKNQGKGFMGQWAAQMGWMNVICERYRTMSIAEILRTYPGSFIIPCAQIKRIRLRESHDDDDGRTSREMTVETVSGKHKFSLAGMSVRDAGRILGQALPGIVK
jgi:hypothetical protein